MSVKQVMDGFYPFPKTLEEYRQEKNDKINPTSFEVVRPGQPSFRLVVEEILYHCMNPGSQNHKELVICKVRRSDNPNVKSVLKVIYSERNSVGLNDRTEKSLCTRAAQLQPPPDYLVKFYGMLMLKEDPSNPIYGIHMKYYPEGNLHKALYCTPQKVWTHTETSLKSIFKSCLVALDILHQKVQLMHRDIKLENFFLLQTPKGRIAVLGDLGDSMPIYGTRKAMTVIGVNQYIFTAPEARAGSSYDYPCDIWALGTLFFTMLFGKDPTCQYKIHFQVNAGSGIASVLPPPGEPNFKAIAHGSPGNVLEFPSNMQQISKDLQQILRDMTSYNPQDRKTPRIILEHPYFKNDSSLAWIQ